MRTSISSFLSILSLLFVELSTFPVEFIQVNIERSPSASRDMVDFFHHIEEGVRSTEQANPHKLLCLNFNTILLRLFARLERSSEAQKASWCSGFHDHATRLARYHRVRGLRLIYRNLSDLSVASSMIKPFVEEDRLESLKLTALFAPED